MQLTAAAAAANLKISNGGFALQQRVDERGAKDVARAGRVNGVDGERRHVMEVDRPRAAWRRRCRASRTASPCGSPRSFRSARSGSCSPVSADGTCVEKIGAVESATSSGVRSVTRSMSLVTGVPALTAIRAAAIDASSSRSSTCTSRALPRISAVGISSGCQRQPWIAMPDNGPVPVSFVHQDHRVTVGRVAHDGDGTYRPVPRPAPRGSELPLSSLPKVPT